MNIDVSRYLSSERITPPSMRYKTIDVNKYIEIYRQSLENYTGFWEREAAQLYWVEKWKTVLTGWGPGARWFAGGRINAYFNIVERHMGTTLWDKAALVWESEKGVVEVYTYGDLHREVLKMSSTLRGLGVRAGDWVLIYAPPIPKAIFTALAAVRLGAPFEYVFTGFGPVDLRKRILNRSPKVVITTDAFLRRGRPINTKAVVDKAVRDLELSVLIIEHLGAEVDIVQNRDYYLDEVSSLDYGESYTAQSDYPLFGLHIGYADDLGYVTHGVGGYLTQTYATTKWIGLRPRDIYFCTVWPGWITGITYVLFGPLMVGSTVVLYEGSIDYPHWGRWWEIIERYGVTIFLTTGAALRLLSKTNSRESYNLDTLRLILTTAEPLEVETWHWTYKNVGSGDVAVVDSTRGGGRIPVVHMYIQTELGTFATGNTPNFAFPPLAPGSAGPPMPGFAIDVVDETGGSVKEKLGELVVRYPWPAVPVEYTQHYVEKWRGGVYYAGDYAIMDKDLYVYPLGRSDGVLKVNGYRLSPGLIEQVIETLPWVKRAVVVGVYDELKFENVVAYVEGTGGADEVKKIVRELLGALAEPWRVVLVEKLPEVSKRELRKKLRVSNM
ncbi:MAG: AMP-binding protein [Pyrobaculum sp.]